ncbi:MAG: lysine--tRNA ligase [Spirochaetia bacterium]
MLTDEQISQSGHWADIWADKVIRAHPDRDVYTCASGITPSGTVHIGNFREIISVELVVRALKQKGKNVRFIYSWDDYDVFRKVPKNMPKPELLEQYLRQPIDAVPDTFGSYDSYAQANEKYIENLLPKVGINPQYIYQSQRYRSSVYAQGIRTALECQDIIRTQLNEFRSQPLEAHWMPISIFCEACHRDDTQAHTWDGEWQIQYTCALCQHQGKLDLRTTSVAKLPWRIDWPMRWAYEQVVFEPAGKDHHSHGGSFTTAEKTSQQVYHWPAPVSFQYDFVRIKGGAGKISSSSGEVVDLKDCLQVYQPELIRFLFCSTRPNSEFAISFDLDVLKNYEDYDRLERLYYEPPASDASEKAIKKWVTSARIYELSQVNQCEIHIPYQISIRHLCTLLQIFEGDIGATIQRLGDVQSEQKERLKIRAACAWFWIQNYAPEDFRFALRKEGDPRISLNDVEQTILREFAHIVPAISQESENDFAIKLYDINKKLSIESDVLFSCIYRVLLGKDKGPRLVNFLYTIGESRLQTILGEYIENIS